MVFFSDYWHLSALVWVWTGPVWSVVSQFPEAGHTCFLLQDLGEGGNSVPCVFGGGFRANMASQGFLVEGNFVWWMWPHGAFYAVVVVMDLVCLFQPLRASLGFGFIGICFGCFVGGWSLDGH